MKFLEYWVYRPVGSVMTALLIFLLGTVALLKTPVDLLPSLETPRITVYTYYPHATPREVEKGITEPLERTLGGVSGLRRLRSSSSEGGSYVVAEFEWGTDLEEALEDVRERVRREEENLPEEAERPLVRKFDSQAMPVMMLSYATEMNPYHAREYVDSHVVYRLERVAGVASVLAWGGGAREVLVDLDVHRMKALKISVSQVLDALREGNVSLPGGNLTRGGRSVRIRVPGKFSSPEEIGNRIVCFRGGCPVPLRSFAEVHLIPSERYYVYRVNRKNSVQLSLYKGAGENTVAVANEVYRVIEEINRELPGGKLVVLFDSSEYVRESLTNVIYAGIIGGFLALGVLYLFLHSLRATFVVGVAVPLSVAACFGLMRMWGFSLNIMSLGGLALGLGMLVDNAVVVLESIYRKRKTYSDPCRGAVEGAREVFYPVLGGTLTTGVVFLPLFFFRGMSGMLFRELGTVVVMSLFASLFVALTLVPMLSRFLVPSGDILSETSGRAEIFSRRYEKSVTFLFRHSRKGIFLFCGALGGMLCFFPLVGSELMPSTDESELRVYFSMNRGTPLEVREAVMCRMEDIMERAVPEIRVLQCAADRDAAGGVFRLRLAPRGARKRDVREIAEEVHQVLQKIPGIRGRVRVPNSILGNLLGGTGEQAVSVEVRGFDSSVARALGEEIRSRGETIPGVTDVTLPEERGVPEYRLSLDREKVASLGSDFREVTRTVRFFLAGGDAGEFYHSGDTFPLRIRGKDLVETDLSGLLSLSFATPSGKILDLANVAGVDLARAPLAISRKDRQRILTLSVAAPSRPPGDLVQDLRKVLQDLPLPEGYSLAFGDSWEEQSRSFRELYRSILLALLLVYMILACQFESLVEPFLVILSVPLGMPGVVGLLFLTDTTWNLQSLMGCLILTGISVNNSLLLVYQAGEYEQRQGFPPEEAVKKAGRERLRPILMTSFSTGIALLPLAFGWGGAMQAPLARALMGGLFSATTGTLFLLPLLYVWVRRFSKRTPERIEKK
ncbi:MAG TPA: efflux RND transporter permease subunit [Synergistaceae bacterium]|nr:efflux RND transporter permease subunit [Synergistaceae bacterium]HPQ37407.1 efflux RND transporter permease subunit [Synergistaceae bacterium]